MKTQKEVNLTMENNEDNFIDLTSNKDEAEDEAEESKENISPFTMEMPKLEMPEFKMPKIDFDEQ